MNWLMACTKRVLRILVKKASVKNMDDNLPDDTTAVVLEIKELDPTTQTLNNLNLIVEKNYKVGDEIDGYRLYKISYPK